MNGIGKADIGLLAKTALQWSYSADSGVKPWEMAAGHRTVQLGGVTTSSQLTMATGWVFQWTIRWDVARVVPLELFIGMPPVLLAHTKAIGVHH